ncbi:MAG: alpha/beta fold hydrolase, partial [Acidimicrobiales bacterium]
MPHFVASTDAITVAVHDLGGPATPAAPTLLFCHANGFCGAVFRPLAERLADGYRGLAVDLRYHGDSVAPDGLEPSWYHFGDDVEAVLDAGLIPEAAALHGIGHSLGGAALVMAAARRPSRFRSLWLYEPIIPPPDHRSADGGPNLMSDAALRRRSTFESPDAAYENFASKPPLDQLHPEALRAYVDGGFATQPDGSVQLKCRPESEAAIFRTGHQHEAWEAAARVRVPTTVV